MPSAPPLGIDELGELLLRRTLAAMRPLGHVEVGDGDWAREIRSAYGRGGGPVIVVATDVPRLGPGHIAAALADMEGGADASFGPALDGGYYMAAVPFPRDELFASDQLALSLKAAGEDGLEVGMLRMERRLRTTDDARAMLADPLLPTEVRELLVNEP